MPPPSQTGDLPSREELTPAWADSVLKQLRPRAKGLFAQGRFLAVDSAAVLALPSDVLRRKADELRAEVEQALASTFGRAVPLRLVVDGAPALTESGAEDEVVDLAELQDAPVSSGVDRLASAFPGAEIVVGGEG
ncbi:hypothetical protein BH18ACT1_BH18ACT1_01510 [soil metagenome]